MAMRLDTSDLFLEVPPFADPETGPPLKNSVHDTTETGASRSKKKKEKKDVQTDTKAKAIEPALVRSVIEEQKEVVAKRKSLQATANDVHIKKRRVVEKETLALNPHAAPSEESHGTKVSSGDPVKQKNPKESQEEGAKHGSMGRTSTDDESMEDTAPKENLGRKQKVKGRKGGLGSVNVGAVDAVASADTARVSVVEEQKLKAKKRKTGQEVEGFKQGSESAEVELKPVKKMKAGVHQEDKRTKRDAGNTQQVASESKAEVGKRKKGMAGFSRVQGSSEAHEAQMVQKAEAHNPREVGTGEEIVGVNKSQEGKGGQKKVKKKKTKTPDADKTSGKGGHPSGQANAVGADDLLVDKQKEKDKAIVSSDKKGQKQTKHKEEETRVKARVAEDAEEERQRANAKKTPIHADSTSQKGGVKDKSGKETKKGPPSLLDKMRARLQGGQFRMLNEKLYTCRSDDAFGFFGKDPGSFFQYHTGYKEQMAHWPRQPVDVIIDWLKGRSPKMVVADFGCGDAKLEASVPNKVHSLDLVAANPRVTACNMAKTPLESASVDVAVFCLSLMGTDYSRFLMEARRALKPGGWLVIAEVKSRFDPANSGADPAHFLTALTKLGFELQMQDASNKMFLMFFLRKSKDHQLKDKKSLQGIDWPVLKPCIYKRR